METSFEATIATLVARGVGLAVIAPLTAATLEGRAIAVRPFAPPAFSGDDEPLRIVAAGAVHSRGLARVSATVSKVGKATGWASLSSNGQVLTVSALDREMHLTKQGCE